MSKVFNNIEDVERYLGVPLSGPVTTPEDANILCYDAETSDVTFYKECKDGLFYKSSIEGSWMYSGSDTLEKEVLWDKHNGYNFAYLRIEQKDVFTPHCLVGVETTKGFITNVVEIGFLDIMNPSYFVYTTESLSKEDLYDVHNIKFFISDDNDETVSFRDYVEMFYEG